MSELATIAVFELKENETYSNLVPEMNELEYKDFLESIKKDGVRQPIHVLLDKTILDGRHRVRACKDVGITHIQALVHNLNDDEAIEFVRDTAIERRNITKGQRIDIILKSEELINELEEKALAYRDNRRKDGTYKPSGPNGPEWKKERTDDTLGEMAGVSGRTFRRMKRVKRESPELYEDIVKKGKSIRKAHDELPSVKKAEPKEEPKHKVKTLTEEEARLKMAYDNLELNLRQLNFYVEKNQSHLFQAIEQKMKDDEDFMNQSEKTLSNLLNLIKTTKKENEK